ncbi:ankyrin repeat-containing domain, PGG domain protein, partial [Tanacetum coccineum]
MLLQQDPLILDKVTLNRDDDMPPHVASMLGHIDFVKEILKQKPEFCMECDSQKRLDLHLASSKGHVEIVKALVTAYPQTCGARDRDGRNPLHLAAIKGRFEAVKAPVQARPHTINFLLLDTTIDVNASNTDKETPKDMLSEGPRDTKDQQIIRACNSKSKLALNHLKYDRKPKFPYGFKRDSKNNNEDWLDKKRNTLIVVASLIETMAFQAGTNPPSGVWQDTSTDHMAGYSIMEYNHQNLYHVFLVSNTLGFVSTLRII